jgi:hypothetical protein
MTAPTLSDLLPFLGHARTPSSLMGAAKAAPIGRLMGPAWETFARRSAKAGHWWTLGMAPHTTGSGVWDYALRRILLHALAMERAPDGPAGVALPESPTGGAGHVSGSGREVWSVCEDGTLVEWVCRPDPAGDRDRTAAVAVVITTPEGVRHAAMLAPHGGWTLAEATSEEVEHVSGEAAMRVCLTHGGGWGDVWQPVLTTACGGEQAVAQWRHVPEGVPVHVVAAALATEAKRLQGDA